MSSRTRKVMWSLCRSPGRSQRMLRIWMAREHAWRRNSGTFLNTDGMSPWHVCLRPFRARIFSRWLSVGLSLFSPEISEITGFRWYIHASDFPPKSQTWWDFEPAKMGSKCFMLKVMYWKVIVFFGWPYRFTAFRACPMSFSTPPY